MRRALPPARSPLRAAGDDAGGLHFVAFACLMLRRFSIEGIALDTKRIETSVDESLMLVTALSPVIGYDNASASAHRADDEGTSLRDAAIASVAISSDDFDRIVIPAHMVGKTSACQRGRTSARRDASGGGSERKT